MWISPKPMVDGFVKIFDEFRNGCDEKSATFPRHVLLLENLLRSEDALAQLYPVQDACLAEVDPGFRSRGAGPGPGDDMQRCQAASWSTSSPDPKSDFFPS